MGTRATVKFYDQFKEDEAILSVYHQCDGYIDGVGHELAAFLKSKTLVNGIQMNMHMDTHANGMGCLAAQYVQNFKTRIGGLYLTTKDDSQDYDYSVRLIDNKIQIEVGDIFKGTPDELLNFKQE